MEADVDFASRLPQRAESLQARTQHRYTVEGVCGSKSDGDFAEKQKLARESTKQAIDEGLPCYGWELDIPEYYVVHGYDDGGYYFSGPRCDWGKGPKPWKELGDSEIGMLEMFSVKPGRAVDDVKSVKEAFGFALEHSKSPTNWIFAKYKAGLGGYDNWIGAVEGGTAHGLGMAYNAEVWSECRGFAVQFLREGGSAWAEDSAPCLTKLRGITRPSHGT